MDELDSWMRRYIDRYRLDFLNTMITELFIEGFPGLHDFMRNRAKNVNRHDGYFQANSLLIDSITKIDDFPHLFISFCEKHSINAELVRIVRKGLHEYESRFGNSRGNLNLMRNRNSDRTESALIPLAPNSGDPGSASQVSSSQDSTSQDSTSQDSTSQDSTSQDSTSQDTLTLTNVFQNQSDIVNRENLIITGNNRDETTPRASVSHEEITDDVISEPNAACLVNILQCTLNGLKGAESNAEVNLSDAELEIPCPCPYHTSIVNLNDSNANTEHGHESEASSSSSSFSSDTANIQRVETELETVSSDTNIQRVESELESVSSDTNMQRVESELETVFSDNNLQRVGNELETVSSDTNMQRYELILPSCKNNIDKLLFKSTTSAFDPNIDRNNPVQKTSQRNKTAFLAEHVTSSPVNVSDDTNNLSEELNSERNNGNLKNNTRKFSPDNQFQEGLVSKDKNLIENMSPNINSQNTSSNDQSDITHDSESWGSYYLSTSDEEDLLPATNRDLEIDSLKENPKLSTHFEEPVLRAYSPQIEENNFQKLICLENSTAAGDNFKRCGPSKTSKVKFVLHSTGPSGIECQEDLDKFKPEAHTEKRVENSAFGDEGKNHGETQLECLSGNKCITTDVKCELRASDHGISDSCNTVVKTVDGEDIKDKQTPVTYGSSNTGPNVSPISLTDSISSETNLKNVNEIDEDTSQQQDCERTQMQYNSDDFHFLHITTSISNVKETGVSSNLMERTSLPLAETSCLASDYSESSEGFQIHTSDDLAAAHSDPSSVIRSSNNVSKGCQPFVRENHIVEPLSTETVSMPFNALSISTRNYTHSNSQSNKLRQTMTEDNSTCTEFCQNDGSDQNLNLSELDQFSSENSGSLEGVHNNIAVASNATVSNITGLLGLVIRILEIYFPELNLRL